MKQVPDKRGYYGDYGGRFVPETVMELLIGLEKEYRIFKNSKTERAKLTDALKNYAGRPTPLYYAESLSKEVGGAKIYLKREDLLHTGAHKINNTLGQILFADFLHKEVIIAETGAGQHGVATASVAAKFGKKCIVFMGEEDIERQAPNVFKMRLLGAEVYPVTSGSKTLKDATSEAIRFWVTNAKDAYFLIGSTVGPHPYPMIVRDFQSVIGRETLSQIRKENVTNLRMVFACVGGGSNSLGMFYPLLRKTDVELIGVEAGGLGLNSGKHAATLSRGLPGVLHGAMSYLLQDENGQVILPHSISAGLDYPGIGPEHSFLKDVKRASYTSVTDTEALDAFYLLTRTEGIIPALESAHAVAAAVAAAEKLSGDESIIVNLSGRGDKDINIINQYSKNNERDA